MSCGPSLRCVGICRRYALTVEVPPEDVLITLKTKCETRGRRRGRRLTAGVDLNVLVTKVLKEGEEEGGAEDPAQKMKQLDTRCVPDNAGRDAGLYPRKHFTTLRARLNAWAV